MAEEEGELGGVIDEEEMARIYSGEQGVPEVPPTGEEDTSQQQAGQQSYDEDLYPDLREQDEDTLLEMGEEQEPEPVKVEDNEVDEKGVPWKNRAMEYQRKLKELEAKQQQPAQPQQELPPPLPQNMPLQQQPPYPQQQVYQQPQPQAVKPQIPHFENTDELVAYIQDMAKSEAQGIIQQQQARQKIQEAEGRILSDFPDMANQQSPLFLWTRYYLQTEYDGDMRRAEDAAHRAARHLGIQARSQAIAPGQKPLPRSKAPLPSSETSTPPTQKPKSTLSPRAKALARKWGQNLDEVEAINKQIIAAEGR